MAENPNEPNNEIPQEISRYRSTLASLDSTNRSFQELLKNVLENHGRLIKYGFFGGTVIATVGSILVANIHEIIAYYDLSHFAAKVALYFISYGLKEVGFGFIVAALAVVAYEYLKEARGDFQRQTAEMEGLRVLENAISTLGIVNDSKVHLSNTTNELRVLANAAYEEKASAVLKHYLDGTDVEKQIRGNLRSLFSEIVQLKDSESEDSQQYLKFINWTLEQGVIPNAKSLNLLEKERFIDPKTTIWEFWFSRPEKAAAQILANQMSILNNSDVYRSVSDPLFYVDPNADGYKNADMESIEDALKTAIRVGVNIFRIFNVHFLTTERARQVLEDNFEALKIRMDFHTSELTKSGNYKVGFLGRNQISEIVAAHPDMDEGVLMSTKFGIFTRDIGNNVLDTICFKTGSTEHITELSMSRTYSSRYMPRFAAMWDVCSTTENPFSKDIDYFYSTMGRE